MMVRKSEVKRNKISASNFQALCDYLCYNGSIEEYKKARSKLNHFVIED